MESNLLKLYPTQLVSSDRRQSNIPVEIERRSGKDRRAEQRLTLKSDLKDDITKVKTNFDKIYVSFKEYDTLSKSSPAYYASIIKNKKTKTNKELINLALSPIPMARRIVNIDNNEEDHNIFKAIGLAAIAFINLKEDLRDIMSIFGKTKSHAPDGYYSKYGFFVGTSAEGRLQKSEWGRSILKLDRTMGETVFDNLIKNKLKVNVTREKFNKEINHIGGKAEKVLRRHVKLEGNKIGKLITLTLYRIPILSLFIVGILETPSIIKAKKNTKLKQATNSALNVVLGIGVGAFFSALLAPINPALPVMGLGVGYYVGGKIAKAIGFKLNTN